MSDERTVTKTTATVNARSQRKLDRRRCILETASRLFAQHGFSECDMECVASELQIAKGTLYLYFPGKQELFLACVDWGMEEMQRVVVEATRLDTDPFGQIARSIWAYLEFFDQHQQYVELLIQERAVFRDRKRGAYFEHREELRLLFSKLYGELATQGLFRSDLPVARLLDSVGALLYGTMLINNAVGRTISLEEQYRALMNTTFGGLTTPAGHTQLAQIIQRQFESAPPLAIPQ